MIIVAVTAVIWGRNNITRNGVKLVDYSKVDQRARQMSDEYMMSLLGANEFTNNYLYDATSSDKCTFGENPIGCSVNYEFLPGRVYGKSTYTVYYSAYSGTPQVKIANHDVPIVLPSCEKDSNNCDFEISLSQLNTIADKYIESGLGRSVRLSMLGNEIVAEIAYCNLNTSGNRKKVKINLKTGDVVWTGNNEECEGII